MKALFILFLVSSSRSTLIDRSPKISNHSNDITFNIWNFIMDLKLSHKRRVIFNDLFNHCLTERFHIRVFSYNLYFFICSCWTYGYQTAILFVHFHKNSLTIIWEAELFWIFANSDEIFIFSFEGFLQKALIRKIFFGYVTSANQLLKNLKVILFPISFLILNFNFNFILIFSIDSFTLIYDILMRILDNGYFDKNLTVRKIKDNLVLFFEYFGISVLKHTHMSSFSQKMPVDFAGITENTKQWSNNTAVLPFTYN